MISNPVSPCPFCASPHAKVTEIDEVGWAVICNQCVGIGPTGASEEDAVGLWNGRHALARNLGLLEGER
jgi:hypothetical protein